MIARLFVLSFLGFAVGAAPASAQITGWLTPHVGGLAGGDPTTGGPVFGASVAAFEVRSWLGAELDIARAISFDDEIADDTKLTTVSLSAIAAPHKARFQPYLLGGVGLMRAEGCVAACSDRFADTIVTANAGGGLQVRLAQWFGVRGDLRWVRALGDHEGLPRAGGGAFDFFRVSVGATFIWEQM